MTTCKSGKRCQKQQFPKKIGKTICQICQKIVWNDILQNFDSERPFAKFTTNSSGKNFPKKVCIQTTTYQKIYQEENADFTWFTWSSLNKLVTYTATTFFTVNNVEQRSGTG